MTGYPPNAPLARRLSVRWLCVLCVMACVLGLAGYALAADLGVKLVENTPQKAPVAGAVVRFQIDCRLQGQTSGPDSKVIAVGLNGDAIKTAVTAAISK